MTGSAPLYATHIPLNPLQRGAVALIGALGALIRCVCWWGDKIHSTKKTPHNCHQWRMCWALAAAPLGAQAAPCTFTLSALTFTCAMQATAG